MASRSETFRTKVETDPENLLFQFSLGQALVEEDSAEKALEPLRFCIENKADWMAPRILLGKCLAKIGETTDAVSILQEALDLAKQQGHEEPESELRELLADTRAD